MNKKKKKKPLKFWKPKSGERPQIHFIEHKTTNPNWPFHKYYAAQQVPSAGKSNCFASLVNAHNEKHQIQHVKGWREMCQEFFRAVCSEDGYVRDPITRRYTKYELDQMYVDLAVGSRDDYKWATENHKWREAMKKVIRWYIHDEGLRDPFFEKGVLVRFGQLAPEGWTEAQWEKIQELGYPTRLGQLRANRTLLHPGDSALILKEELESHMDGEGIVFRKIVHALVHRVVPQTVSFVHGVSMGPGSMKPVQVRQVKTPEKEEDLKMYLVINPMLSKSELQRMLHVWRR